uniref:Bifunctional diguanylate cyclase/phosphodiesterase n=1 Tax=Desertifilum tharense IPPAS B-1220 TaxID=1781255 RepID=A0ACD5H1X5_9CYAN
MYRAKQQGRNNYQLYTSAIGTKVLERLVLENNLYKALDSHEFLLHYQPQINLENGQIVGMEALLRWQSQDLGGLVSPLQFIPLAEETGLISPIGEWVLRTACAQNRAWQLAGLPPPPIAVNLSARQFQNKNLASTIHQILKETGLDSQYLEIEITESIAIQDMNFTIEVLHHLRNQNIQIAMDDFGTGYSSLKS